MANTTTPDDAPVNSGVLTVEYLTVNITSLANAGNEPWDPAGNSSLDDPTEVSVTGVENGNTYVVTWDHLNQQFNVVDFTGANVAAGTDVGEVKVRVEGRR